MAVETMLKLTRTCPRPVQIAPLESPCLGTAACFDAVAADGEHRFLYREINSADVANLPSRLLVCDCASFVPPQTGRTLEVAHLTSLGNRSIFRDLHSTGAVAQLGARLTGSQEVTGSTPVGSIIELMIPDWRLASNTRMQRET